MELARWLRNNPALPSAALPGERCRGHFRCLPPPPVRAVDINFTLPYPVTVETWHQFTLPLLDFPNHFMFITFSPSQVNRLPRHRLRPRRRPLVPPGTRCGASSR